MTDTKHTFSKPAAYFWFLRPNRTIMVASITGTAAFVAGAGIGRALWMTLAGWCLAVGGFSLDFYADRHLDGKGVRALIRHNPLVGGAISLRTGLVLSITFMAASFFIILPVAPWALFPWVLIVGIVIGLAVHIFDTPIARALTLGLLQGLYFIMGASAEQVSPAIWIMAVMLFFAMFGGRGVIDIRDFTQDEASGVQTLPRRYGIKRTVQVSTVCLIISYILSFTAYFTGEFSRIYLYFDIVFIAAGLVCAWIFARNPSPRMAYYMTLIYMMGLGFVICLGMIAGSIY